MPLERRSESAPPSVDFWRENRLRSVGWSAAAAATRTNRMKVAVVGSGLAGLHVAWLLSCPEHFPPGHPLAATGAEVHLFERAPAIGFDAHSVDVCGGRGRVDVPMRGFYVSYYPRLATLYRTAGVQYARRYGGRPSPRGRSSTRPEPA